MVGVDVFVHCATSSPEFLAGRLSTLATDALKLQMITNRGVKVWPHGFPETFCTDHWRCRFVAADALVSGAQLKFTPVPFMDVLFLLHRLVDFHLYIIKTEHLYLMDGQRAFSLGQGE